LPNSFGHRLSEAFQKHGQLCVGVDPHAALLEDWGLSDDITGLDTFAKTVVDAAAGRVGIIKPQVSFFERFGSRGFAVLEEIGERARESGLLVIMDAKRGDIGSTMEAYFEAWLGKSAPFYSDALTVSPYLGLASLTPTIASAFERGKGVFVLAATSNPEGFTLQNAQVEGVAGIDEDGNPIQAEPRSIAAAIWGGLEQINTVTAGPGELIGSAGAVLGATLNLNRFGLGTLTTLPQAVQTPILAPGFGAQGARLADAGRLFGTAAGQVIANVSRSVVAGGAQDVASAIDAAKAELAEGLIQ
jgi:orotidine-5'-phosphate decarboxylase